MMEASQSTSVLVLTRSHTDATSSSPTSELTKTTLLPLRKACDSCRRRKTRCDRKIPCNACTISCIKCEYLAVHQRRGPKRRRICDTGGSEDGLHRLSRSKNIIISDDSLSPSISETVVHDTPENQLLPNISSPCPRFEVLRAPSLTSSIETSGGDHQNSYQEDGPETYHTFSPNTMDSLVTQCLITGNSPNTEHLAAPENNFFSGLPSPSSSSSSCSSSSSTATPPTNRLTDTTFSTFVPYIRLFLEHIYPIMPVFDRNKLVTDLELRVDDQGPLPLEEIAMFSALSAAVILQLNLTVEDENTAAIRTQSAHIDLNVDVDEIPNTNKLNSQAAAFFVSQSLSARQQSDFIDAPTVNWILTSFFLFSYHGQLERHTSAWYYLREAISLSLELKLHIEEPYSTRDPSESQRRKRIFWLLFVTERGYALQRRQAVMLQPSISLPLIFDSEDPCLLYGFVNLINLFKFVDSKFSYMWGDDSKLSADGQPIADAEALSSWLISFQENISRVSVPLSESIETQRVDIMVTREWLHMVAWQMTVKLGLLKACDERGKGTFLHLKYPFVPAKDLVTVISATRLKSLESHGIGMEQKISEVAICLTDVMACTCIEPQTDLNSLRQGEDYLRVFLGLLSRFRGQPSRYLETVLNKALPFISNKLCKQPTVRRENFPVENNGDEIISGVCVNDSACTDYVLL
ncbi:hypothetical protein TWF506_011478 [Arthrobotrys conoides]|uniref:Zn(2)-C6 fungal-type domain-containing protein n=1 Tax=Arthrobotrys conoides TaxID=74498 RepID=A0AAN8NGX7_9PEZI